jgi:predicted N-acyltransferase
MRSALEVLMANGDANGSDLAADLAFMETLRLMRAQFHSAVSAAAQTDDEAALLALRQDSLHQLAEFLFALKGYGINDADKIEQLASLHNDHLLKLRDDRDRMARYGLSVDRIEGALFTGDVLRKLIANFDAGAPAIDQSDLARFLVTVMSSETCRKLVLACDKAGFVERVRSPYGAVLVRSRGLLEEIYGSTLREARHAATQ